MTDDLIERLRRLANYSDPDQLSSEQSGAMYDAANRIEELQAELARLNHEVVARGMGGLVLHHSTFPPSPPDDLRALLSKHGERT